LKATVNTQREQNSWHAATLDGVLARGHESADSEVVLNVRAEGLGLSLHFTPDDAERAIGILQDLTRRVKGSRTAGGYSAGMGEDQHASGQRPTPALVTQSQTVIDPHAAPGERVTTREVAPGPPPPIVPAEKAADLARSGIEVE